MMCRTHTPHSGIINVAQFMVGLLGGGGILEQLSSDYGSPLLEATLGTLSKNSLLLIHSTRKKAYFLYKKIFYAKCVFFKLSLLF